MQIKVCDDVRIVEGVNTQTRYLPLITQIVRRLGKGTVARQILKDWMIEWSNTEEESNSFYREHTGKLTEITRGKAETGAFDNYLIFTERLGFVTIINDAIRCSKFGLLFLDLLNKCESSKELSTLESFVFLFFLFQKDADTLLTLLEIISIQEAQKVYPVKEKIIRENYFRRLTERLEAKNNQATDLASVKVADNIIKIRGLLEKEQPYAHKHLIPPRLEWLSDLYFLIKSSNGYHFSPRGITGWENISNIQDSNIKDINQGWIEQQAFGLFASIIFYGEQTTHFRQYTINEQQKMVGDLFEKFYAESEDYEAMRLSYLPTMLYTTLSLVSKHKIITEFSDVEKLFEQSFITNSYRFSLKKTSRLNESYISLSLL